jgi:lysophospholipase L1-like esterase
MKYFYSCIILIIFLSCDDTSWKAEIENLQNQINLNKELITQLQSNIYVTNIIKSDDEYIINFSDNTSLTIYDVHVPIIEIGDNGNWFIDGVDIGYTSQGASAIITIGANGNWFVDGVDTGESSTGETPTISIGSNGNWYIDGVDTGNSSEGSNPVITIGTNGNWFINGVDTGEHSSGETPTISIGANGNWFINGVDTGNASQGNNAPYIIAIIEEEGNLIFKFSDDTELIVPINSDIKKVVCWGDSLTTGAGGFGTSYRSVLQDELGDDYDIINAGVGGEKSLTIAARQGGIPMYIDQSIEISSRAVQVVMGSRTNSNMKSTYNDSMVTPLFQGGGSTINSCFIDSREYNLRWNGAWNAVDGEYTIELISSLDAPITIPSKSLIYTSSKQKYRNTHANIFFIGQNGGYSGGLELIDQIKKMIDFSGTSNYLVIGLHAAGSVSSMMEREVLMEKEFGARYVNIRKYLITNALSDAGLVATSEDLLAIEQGQCPPQLLYDAVHFNSAGYTVLGKLFAKRFQLLGI